MEITDEIVKKYDRQIWRVADKVLRKCPKDVLYRIDREDLHSVGYMTLVRAYKRYDPDKAEADGKPKAKFSTYLEVSLHRDMWEYLRQNTRAVAISKKRNQEIITATNLLNEGKTYSEIQKIMKKSHYELSDILQNNIPSYSFDYDDFNGNGSALKGDEIVDTSIEDERFARDIYLTIMEQCDLTDEEKLLLKLRFGLGGQRQLTVKEIAEYFGKSPMTIDRRMKKAKEKYEPVLKRVYGDLFKQE